jgi:hypothetical protein
MADWYDNSTPSACTTKSRGAHSLIMIVCSTIWAERNARIFDGKEKPASRLFAEIKETAMLWSKAGAKHLAKLVGLSYRE